MNRTAALLATVVLTAAAGNAAEPSAPVDFCGNSPTYQEGRSRQAAAVAAGLAAAVGLTAAGVWLPRRR